MTDLTSRSSPTESYESMIAEMTQIVLRSHLSTSSGCLATTDDMIVIRHEKLISIDMSVGDAIQLYNILATVQRELNRDLDDSSQHLITTQDEEN